MFIMQSIDFSLKKISFFYSHSVTLREQYFLNESKITILQFIKSIHDNSKIRLRKHYPEINFIERKNDINKNLFYQCIQNNKVFKQKCINQQIILTQSNSLKQKSKKSFELSDQFTASNQRNQWQGLKGGGCKITKIQKKQLNTQTQETNQSLQKQIVTNLNISNDDLMQEEYSQRAYLLEEKDDQVDITYQNQSDQQSYMKINNNDQRQSYDKMYSQQLLSMGQINITSIDNSIGQKVQQQGKEQQDDILSSFLKDFKQKLQLIENVSINWFIESEDVQNCSLSDSISVDSYYSRSELIKKENISSKITQDTLISSDIQKQFKERDKVNKRKHLKYDDISFIQKELKNRHSLELGEYFNSGGEADIFYDGTSIKRVCIIDKENKVMRSRQEFENIQSIQNKENIMSYKNAIFMKRENQVKYVIFIMEQCYYDLQEEISLRKDLGIFVDKKVKQIFSIFEVLKITFDLLIGLIELRIHNIYHSDIKPSNILITKLKNYVISDFGLSQKISFYNPSFFLFKGCTQGYVPNKIKIPFYHDIFSVAKTFQELLPLCNHPLILQLNKEILVLLDERNQDEINCIKLPMKFIKIIIKESKDDRDVRSFLEYFLEKINRIQQNFKNQINKENKLICFQTHLQFAKMAIKICSTIEKSKLEQLKAQYSVGKCYFNLKKYSKYLITYLQIIQQSINNSYFESIEENFIFLKSIKKIAYFYEKQTDFKQSLKLLLSCKKYYKQFEYQYFKQFQHAKQEMESFKLKLKGDIYLNKLLNKEIMSTDKFYQFQEQLNSDKYQNKNCIYYHIFTRLLKYEIQKAKIELPNYKIYLNIMQKILDNFDDNCKMRAYKIIGLFYYQNLKQNYPCFKTDFVDKLADVLISGNKWIKEVDQDLLNNMTISFEEYYFIQRNKCQNIKYNKYLFYIGIYFIYLNNFIQAFAYFNKYFRNLRNFHYFYKKETKVKLNSHPILKEYKVFLYKQYKNLVKVDNFISKYLQFQLKKKQSCYLQDARLCNYFQYLEIDEGEHFSNVEEPVQIIKTFLNKLNNLIDFSDQLNLNKINNEAIMDTARYGQQYYIQLTCFKYLSCLLNLNICNNCLLLLEKDLKLFIHIKELSFTIKWNHLVREDYASTLGQSLEKLKFIDTLTFKIISETKNNFLEVLSKYLSNKTNLLHLSIYVNELNTEHGNNVTSIGVSIGNMQQLKTFYLKTFNYNYIWPEGAIGLVAGFKKQQNLVELNITFSSNNGISVQGAVGLGESFINLTNLKRLTFYIGNNQILNEGAQSIGKGLKSLKNLEKLEFTIEENGIDYEIVMEFIESLYHLKNLKALQFDIIYNFRYELQKFIIEGSNRIPKLYKYHIINSILSHSSSKLSITKPLNI